MVQSFLRYGERGSQRITSKVGNSGIFTSSPVNTTDQQAKLAQQTTNIKERFDSLGVKYSGVQQTGGLISSTPSGAGGSYFYHPDHLGSSSLITNGSGDLVQHVQYVPFGEVFVEERNATWSTPYKFNGKEQDEETGLCYYGARYYDPKTSVWLSVDPLAEKYPNIGSYVYCLNNPANMVDPDGRWPKAIHHKLLDNAFGAKSPYAKIIGKAELTLMKTGSDNADGISNGNQADSREFIHGMKPKSISITDAKKAANKWIQDNVKEFVETGNFEKLGEALHTIEDETCPSHRDENGNPQEYNPPFYSPYDSNHGNKENPDKIKENNGKNGYISTKELAKRYKKAEVEMQKLMNSALKQRAEYIQAQEERKNISKKVLTE